MRSFLILAGCLAACGGSSPAKTGEDLGMSADLRMTSMDLAVRVDADTVMPFNMPGKIDCYTGPLCSTTSATPICCDGKADGSFSDSCVATAAACLATDSTAKTFQCGQAADCGAGMICCGDVGTATSGTQFFTSTTCAASCPAGDKQLCVTEGECKTAGSQCVGQTISGRDVGLCQ